LGRAGRWCGALLIGGLLAGCSDGGEDTEAARPPTSTTAPASTVPATVQPGAGWLSLDQDPIELEVTGCSGVDASAADPSAQKVYELVATATVDGDEVTVTANEFRSDSRDAVAVSQTVTVSSGEGDAAVGVQARRSFFDDHWLDLNEPAVDEALFERRGDLLTVEAKFGPQGSREGDPGIAEGALVARCPDGEGG
jgi:hypothetical protein